MRIAQVTPFYPPVVGGVESAVENISTLLVKHGHNVDVYTSSPDGFQSEEVVNGVNVRRVLAHLPSNIEASEIRRNTHSCIPASP